jgi:hypothetical protein
VVGVPPYKPALFFWQSAIFDVRDFHEPAALKLFEIEHHIALALRHFEPAAKLAPVLPRGPLSEHREFGGSGSIRLLERAVVLHSVLMDEASRSVPRLPFARSTLLVLKREAHRSFWVIEKTGCPHEQVSVLRSQLPREVPQTRGK